VVVAVVDLLTILTGYRKWDISSHKAIVCLPRFMNQIHHILELSDF